METNFKHTPGPWHISNGGAFIEHDGLPIAAVSMSSTEQLANTKLIAAAPDLLKELCNMVDCWDADTFQDIDIEYARAAIRKATE